MALLLWVWRAVASYLEMRNKLPRPKAWSVVTSVSQEISRHCRDPLLEICCRENTTEYGTLSTPKTQELCMSFESFRNLEGHFRDLAINYVKSAQNRVITLHQ